MKFYILFALTFLNSSLSWSRGDMILIGGGARPKIILTKIIEVSRGKILVVGLASQSPLEAGTDMVSEFSNHGGKAELFKCLDWRNVDLPDCINQINTAGLVYFTGGDQLLLMKAFQGTKALELLKKRFNMDLSLAGTSAGTAIMNRIMISGQFFDDNDPNGVKAGMAEIYEGFGILKKLIVDQHFLTRKRKNRLLSTVVVNPNLVGVGIDEATAIHMKNENEFAVLGDSKVMIIDARKAEILKDSNGYDRSKGVITTLLESGQTYKLFSE